MTLIQFVASYGYAAVLAGTLLEGETILLLAGFAAQQGHLSFALVVFVAFIGGTTGDQVFFWCGRRWGVRLQERFPNLRVRMASTALLLKRWDATLIVVVRFLYGLRIAGPIAMGALGVGRMRFAIFNAVGAAIWAVVIGGLGYLLGGSLEMLLGEIEGYESVVLWGVLGAVAAFFAVKGVMRVVRAM